MGKYLDPEWLEINGAAAVPRKGKKKTEGEEGEFDDMNFADLTRIFSDGFGFASEKKQTKEQKRKARKERKKMAYDTGYSGYSGGGSTYVACKHDGDRVVFQLNGIRFHGAAKLDMDKPTNAADQKTILINLTGMSVNSTKKDPIISCPWKNELQEYTTPEVEEILLDWPDRGVPALAPMFWRKLLDKLVEHKYTDVYVCCTGGHGRTGTALSAFLMVADNIRTDDAVTMVRELHCKEAVETTGQLSYLDWVDKAFWPEEFAEAMEERLLVAAKKAKAKETEPKKIQPLVGTGK